MMQPCITHQSQTCMQGHLSLPSTLSVFGPMLAGFEPTSTQHTCAFPCLPSQELCDAGTLLKAIKLNTFSPEASSSSGPGSSTTGASGSGTPAPSPAAASAVSKGQYHMRALLRTAREVARGVAFLHSLNIIHGDLKPGENAQGNRAWIRRAWCSL